MRELYPWTVPHFPCTRDFQRTWCQGQVVWHTLCTKNICGFRVTLIIHTESWIYLTPPFLWSHTVSELSVTQWMFYQELMISCLYFGPDRWTTVYLFLHPSLPLHLVWFPLSVEAICPLILTASMDYNQTNICLDYICPPFITLMKNQTQELCNKSSMETS